MKLLGKLNTYYHNTQNSRNNPNTGNNPNSPYGGIDPADLSASKKAAMDAAETLSDLSARRAKEKDAFNQANSASGANGNQLATAKKRMTKKTLAPSIAADEDLKGQDGTSKKTSGLPALAAVMGARGLANSANTSGGMGGAGPSDTSSNPDGGPALGAYSDGVGADGLGMFEGGDGNNFGPGAYHSSLSGHGMSAKDYKNIVDSANNYRDNNGGDAKNPGDLTLWDIVTNAYFRSYKDLVDEKHLKIENRKEK